MTAAATTATAIPSHLRWRWERSNAIFADAYRRSTKSLYLTFPTGETYVYGGVSASRVRLLRRAERKGTYFHNHIRNCYPCQRISGPWLLDANGNLGAITFSLYGCDVGTF